MVRAGDVMSVYLACNGSTLKFLQATVGDGIGGVLHIAPRSGAAGSVTTLPAGAGLLLWLRRIGGRVAVSHPDGSGAKRELERTESRAAVSLQGEACTEDCFQLEAGLAEGDVSLEFRLDLDGGEKMELLDYGAAVL